MHYMYKKILQNLTI